MISTAPDEETIVDNGGFNFSSSLFPPSSSTTGSARPTTMSTFLVRRRRLVLFGGTLAIAFLIGSIAVSRVRRDTHKIINTGPAVTGSFHLDQVGFARSACDLIEEQFESTTECLCSLDEHHISSVNYGCRHSSSVICHGAVCGVPSYTGTLSLEQGAIGSHNFCLNALHVGLVRVGNLCVSVTTAAAHPDSGGGGGVLKKCKASMDGRMCHKCQPCNGGTGIELDCSRHGTNAKSTTCDAVGLVSAIKGQPDSIAPFVPSFRIHEH